jgi:hypothetical protein
MFDGNLVAGNWQGRRYIHHGVVFCEEKYMQ